MNIINIRFKISVGFRKTLLFVITDSAQVEDKAVDSLYIIVTWAAIQIYK